ncbi:MAG TPA: GspH/FimT family pseudopilin [Steroidobacteraceae bacterium]|nr:GspH/FimT family pseudopilin [Steroidobacteraceae bacterium]
MNTSLDWSNHRGFSLLELCVALALVALLAGLSAPSFRQSLRAAAVRTAAQELMTGLQQTRGTAIVESRPGVLCLADVAGNCAASEGPAPAWRAFVESGGGSRTLAARALPAGITLRGTRARVRFSERALAASTATLTICDAAGVAAPRAIVVSQTARARFATPAAGACRA